MEGAVTKVLEYRSLIVVKARSAGLLSLREGRIWLVEDGEGIDYTLSAGETIALAKGKWRIQALERSTLDWRDLSPARSGEAGRRSALAVFGLGGDAAAAKGAGA